MAFPSLGALIIGCSQRLDPIFDRSQHHISWPSPPARERIRYVGQLASSADLKPPRKPFQALGDFLVGAKEPQRLYGPRSVVRTSDGTTLWIADPGGRCVHVFDLQDRSYKKIESVGRSHLLCPIGLCLGPQESIFVCDAEDNTIHRFAKSGADQLQSDRQVVLIEAAGHVDGADTGQTGREGEHIGQIHLQRVVNVLA